jgi:hypothetical protein
MVKIGALYALTYSYNSFLDQQANIAGIPINQLPGSVSHTSPDALLNLLFQWTNPDDTGPSMPTPAYDELIKAQLATNHRMTRNEFLVNTNFSDDQIRLCLELLNPSFRLGIIDKGADGARQPHAYVLAPPSRNPSARNIIWLVNDGHGAGSHVANQGHLGDAEVIGHWEGIGPSGDLAGTKTVKSWNYPHPAVKVGSGGDTGGGEGADPKGKGKASGGLGGFGGADDGQSDSDFGDDGDNESDGDGKKKGKRGKKAEGKKAEGKKGDGNRVPRGKYGIGRGRGERPWNGNGQWVKHP